MATVPKPKTVADTKATRCIVHLNYKPKKEEILGKRIQEDLTGPNINYMPNDQRNFPNQAIFRSHPERLFGRCQAIL